MYFEILKMERRKKGREREEERKIGKKSKPRTRNERHEISASVNKRLSSLNKSNHTLGVGGRYTKLD